MLSGAAPPAVPSPEVLETARTLADFMRFMVRLPDNDGVSLAELGALGALVRRGSLRICELAADQEMTQPGMTQLVTRLEREGLVARAPDPADRRAVRVLLTEAGRELFRERDASRSARFGELYRQLDEEERGRLRAALPVLTRLMEIKESETGGLT
ncbi:MAG TPA: MarR family transcriptional regulator [Solirubrobacteraceae bacterium]|nr:MarR family transcriptional regulator [Solirubrobacteraceae bacterium]